MLKVDIILRSIKDTYLTLDLRSIALFRIALGVTLLTDIFVRIGNATEYMSNAGLYPNHYSLFNPPARYWSLFHAFSYPWEIKLALIITGIVYLMFTLGAGGILVRILTLILAVSINTRNIWLENGGHVVINLFLIWSVFLPLDQRFSIQKFLLGGLTFKEWLDNELRPGSVTSLACLGVLVSIACIYSFNFLTKTGHTWTGGSGVYYSLWLGGRSTWLAVFMRDHVPYEILRLATHLVLFFEGLIPFLLFSPLFVTKCRMSAIMIELMLHAGIGLCMIIGPFSPIMMSISLSLIPSPYWNMYFSSSRYGNDFNAGAQNIKAAFRTIIKKGYQFLLKELLCFLLIYYVITQSLVTYWDWMRIPHTYRAPEWTNFVRDYFRVPQNWRMFAQDVPESAQYVVWVGEKGDGSLEDIDTGRNFDPDHLERYFLEPSPQDYIRVEWDSRFQGILKDISHFVRAYITSNYLQRYRKVSIIVLRLRTKDPYSKLLFPVESETIFTVEAPSTPH